MKFIRPPSGSNQVAEREGSAAILQRGDWKVRACVHRDGGPEKKRGGRTEQNSTQHALENKSASLRGMYRFCRRSSHLHPLQCALCKRATKTMLRLHDFEFLDTKDVSKPSYASVQGNRCKAIGYPALDRSSAQCNRGRRRTPTLFLPTCAAENLSRVSSA